MFPELGGKPGPGSGMQSPVSGPSRCGIAPGIGHRVRHPTLCAVRRPCRPPSRGDQDALDPVEQRRRALAQVRDLGGVELVGLLSPRDAA